MSIVTDIICIWFNMCKSLLLEQIQSLCSWWPGTGKALAPQSPSPDLSLHFNSLKSSVRFSPSLIDSVEFSPATVYVISMPQKLVILIFYLGSIVKNSLLVIYFTWPVQFIFVHWHFIPQDWVTGNLIPAFQRNKRNLVSNYHPIAKFNVFSCEDNGANYFATHFD